MNQPQTRQKLTVPKILAKKKAGEKITMLTAYDFTMASLLDQSGVDTILVGDSLGMVVQGHDTTIPVTLDEMIYHGRLVCRGVTNALVIVDLPFPINYLGIERCIESAGRVLKETGCTAVKLEGGTDQAAVIQALVAAGIPVMAHTGLRPQSVHTLGGYKVQRDEQRLLDDARSAEQAGAFGIVLECIPADMAGRISAQLSIPTIGIGSGPQCDGQVLVMHDMLGMTIGRIPKFAKQMTNLSEQIRAAAADWSDEVRTGTFPAEEHSF